MKRASYMLVMRGGSHSCPSQVNSHPAFHIRKYVWWKEQMASIIIFLGSRGHLYIGVVGEVRVQFWSLEALTTYVLSHWSSVS